MTRNPGSYSNEAIQAAQTLADKELPEDKRQWLTGSKLKNKEALFNLERLQQRICSHCYLISQLLKDNNLDLEIDSDGATTDAFSRLKGIIEDTRKITKLVGNISQNKSDKTDRKLIDQQNLFARSGYRVFTKNIPPRNTIRHLHEVESALEEWLKKPDSDAAINAFCERNFTKDFAYRVLTQKIAERVKSDAELGFDYIADIIARASYEDHARAADDAYNDETLQRFADITKNHFKSVIKDSPAILRAHADQLEFYSDDIVKLFPLAASDQGRGEGGGTPPHPPSIK